MILRYILAAAMALVLTGCGGGTSEPEAVTTAPEAAGVAVPELPANITIVNPGLLPEGIEYDTKNNRFLVGSLSQGTIFIVANDGTLTPFIQDPEIKSSVGIEVDEERNRLLVANADAAAFQGAAGQAKLGIYNLDTGERIAMVDLGALGPEGAKAHFANDVTVGGDGSVYITDTMARVVYKVDANNTPSVFLPNLFANLEQHVLNGIVYHPSGYLLVAETIQGLIYAVPAASPTDFRTVTLSEPVTGADGIVWAANGDLLVTCNGAARTVALRSSDDWQSAEITATNTYQVQATTAAVAGEQVFVVHPQFGDATAAPFIEKVTLQ